MTDPTSNVRIGRDGLGIARHVRGHRPPRPGQHRLRAAQPGPAPSVTSADLQTKWPEIREQLSLGSCVAWTMVEAFRFHGGPWCSALAEYFEGRAIEGSLPADDCGMSLADGAAAAQQHGLCLEATWPYDIASFDVAPPIGAFSEMPHHRIADLVTLATLDDLKNELAAGRPVQIGFSMPQNMLGEDAATTGKIAAPGKDEPIVGGHGVNAVGFDDATQLVKFANHWGSWGQGGFGFLPYAFWAQNLVSEMISIRSISTT